MNEGMLRFRGYGSIRFDTAFAVYRNYALVLLVMCLMKRLRVIRIIAVKLYTWLERDEQHIVL